MTEFKAGNNKKYKIERIGNSIVYEKNLTANHPLSFYYLISWKSYLKKENIWELTLAVQHL